MLALVIALIGIGFTLGVLTTDWIVARPLRTGLKTIKDYGFKNSGYGYTCSRIANNTLNDETPLEGIRFK